MSVNFVARPYLTCKYCMNTFVTQTNQESQFSVFKTGDMEKPSCLVYGITKGISQLTEADLDKTTSDLFQVTKQQVEQIAESVELHFDGGDANFPFVNGRCHLKRSMPFLRTVVAI